MTYPEAVEYLYSLGNEVLTIKLGLDRIRRVLQALGNPQNSFRVIHAAGTNGKGSTCAMIEAGLRTAGVRTGLFISPHLQEPTERIQIAGFPVSRESFASAFDTVHQTAMRLNLDCHPTYFETVTAMAFWLFREMGVETGVIETGLGGRLDATNVVQPEITIITAIDFDHQAYLGNTLEAIAGEKAGILKAGVRAVMAPQLPEVQTVLDRRAAELGVPLIKAEDFPARDLELDARGARFSLFNPPIALRCPLAGEHQVENAVTAALALRALGVSPEGIAEARWPGRLELVAPNPDTILDGAHNPGGARALAGYLARFYRDRRIWLIFGAMRDKAVEEVGSILFPLAQELVFTAPQNPRALAPETIAGLAGRGRVEPDIHAALEYVQRNADAEDAIVVSGSLFLVGEARTRLSAHAQTWPAIL